MNRIPRISIHDYNYELPEDRIAKYPVVPKHNSKLLVFDKGNITHDTFLNLPNHLNANEVILVNNTKVIPARLWFDKGEGVWIQIFLLKPLSHDWSTWQVMVGNRRKFKEHDQLSINTDEGKLTLSWGDRENNIIIFESTGLSIPEWIEQLGEIPLPPYLNRDAEESDKQDYQAIFAKNKGAVAAPTASLHFTPELLVKMQNAGIQQIEATLHVGAGTFKPVSVDFVDEHEMHAEQFEIDITLIEELLSRNSGVIALGTTACRVLESLPLLGAKLILGELDDVFVAAEDGYREVLREIPTRDALEALLDYIKMGDGKLRGETQIFMVPGFSFRLSSGMITNFHQPKSTLMLLIAAFVGSNWPQIYEEAMANGYRFLSYGDGSLLRGEKNIKW